jgi:hypothetical protein
MLVTYACPALPPQDSELVVRVARALVTTHDYQRAIDYYNKVDQHDCSW